MLKLVVLPVGESGTVEVVMRLVGRFGTVASIRSGGVCRDVRLVVLRDGAERSTEVLAVCRECGR